VDEIPKKGVLIGIEGIDAAGKRTQAALLANWLRKNGVTTGMTSFPDYTTAIGKEIHGFFHGGREYPSEVVHMLLAANRWENKGKVESMLAKNQAVVVDRYTESNLAYGVARGLPLAWLQNLEVGLPKTDLVLVLDAPPATTFKRRPSTTDRYELDARIQEQAREAYRRLAPKFGWRVIDASGDIREIHRSVISEAADIFPSVGSVKVQREGTR
jgi:dTMP kinase